MNIRVVNKHLCEEGFVEVQKYLHSYGIQVNDVKDSRQVMICLTAKNPLWRLITILGEHGRAEGYGAMAYVNGSKSDSKVILHELLHLLGAEHSFSGVMFPLYDFMFLATGMSQGTLREIQAK